MDNRPVYFIAQDFHMGLASVGMNQDKRLHANKDNKKDAQQAKK